MSSPPDRSDPGAVFVPPGTVPEARRPSAAGIVAGVLAGVQILGCLLGGLALALFNDAPATAEAYRHLLYGLPVLVVLLLAGGALAAAGVRRWVLAVACVVSLGFSVAFTVVGASGDDGSPDDWTLVVAYAVLPVIMLILLPFAGPRTPRPS